MYLGGAASVYISVPKRQGRRRTKTDQLGDGSDGMQRGVTGDDTGRSLSLSLSLSTAIFPADVFNSLEIVSLFASSSTMHFIVCKVIASLRARPKFWSHDPLFPSV